ncbi:stage III sporulation protein AA [Heliobacterium undosum]|uniref:Stage III sporulation protein AA n=2 Tax=Heliomicrobium undosum TaxID=121734 RepID=A0A845L1W8_9FIRM|nr:stage III sporulation protein AA [Heliomicrobium undosum]
MTLGPSTPSLPNAPGVDANWTTRLLPYLAPSLRSLLTELLVAQPRLIDEITEIRLRAGRPLALCGRTGDQLLRSVTEEELIQTIHLIAHCSVYALEQEFRQGFLTLPGGHRVGLAGRVILDGGRVKTIHPVSSLNIRIARQFPGVADPLLPQLLAAGEGVFYSTLIISPPSGGKTTLLRDIIRQISAGRPEIGLPGMTVGLVDERSEVAACYRGCPQNDVGPRTDVLDGCPKAEGLLRLLRSMGPQVLATDEIGREEDVLAVEEAVHSGVTLLATAHGRNREELLTRPGLSRMLKWNVFQRLVVLSRREGPGTLEGLYDADGNRLEEGSAWGNWSARR